MIRGSIALACFCAAAWADRVKVEFDPSRPEIGPFPTNALTVADEGQRTGLRVNLPVPDCEQQPSLCSQVAALNELDGFNVQARVTVKLSGDVDVSTLQDGVFVYWLDGTEKLSRVNRIVWDPATYTMRAKPDDVLRQGQHYALLVTDAVKDLNGEVVTADDGFAACLNATGQPEDDYCRAVNKAVLRAGALLEGRQVVGASVFTTQSGSAMLEAAWHYVSLGSPGAVVQQTVKASSIQSITLRQQTTVDGDLEDGAFPASASTLAFLGINRLVFGTFQSPRFLNEKMVIPQLPTNSPLPEVQSLEEVGFHVLLPSTPPPPGGYPVLLAGHGFRDYRLAGPSILAYSFMRAGYAIVALNAVGHAYGPKSRILLGTSEGTLDLFAGGRGVDLNGDGRIENGEGCVVLTPELPVGTRDCLRQTAVDWMVMVRAIRLGLDLDGDGHADLDGEKISYWGQSLGAFYGTDLLAVEPAIQSGVLNVGGASAAETARISPAFRGELLTYFAARQPSLLNLEQDFDEQYAGRDAGVTVLSMPGAAELQEEFERLEWLEASGAPSTYAPLLKTAPLEGLAPKRVLFQFAIGDQTVPNPSNSLLVRAADGREQTSLYRHDLAFAARPEIPEDPHAYFSFLLDPNAAGISLAVLDQVATFVRSGKDEVPDANPMARLFFGLDLFETPAILPETLGFVHRAK
jgi:hypothetical protein